MKADKLSNIYRKSKNAEHQTQWSALDPIDLDRPFMPENRTQLYFTDVYWRLSDRQRLRYNQLFACRVNEYIMVLESDMVEYFLVPLLQHQKVRENSDLHLCLEVMIEEERRHYQMFLDLNRRCFPSIYSGSKEKHFTEFPLMARNLFPLLRLAGQKLPFPIWYIMAMEEEAIDLAKAMLKCPNTETLGELEPNFVAIHREHMKDEARHVAIDLHVSENCFDGRALQRKVGAWFFKLTMKAMTYVGSKGPGAKVIYSLIEEFPELLDIKNELFTALVSLNGNSNYQKSLFNRSSAPNSFQMFDEIPEFDDLGKVLVGYDRQIP